MAKEHYWTYLLQEDDDETSIDPTIPLVTLSSAQRAIDDTLTRAIVFAQLTATVHTVSPIPNVDWLAAAEVDWLFFFDTESDGHAVNLIDNDPMTVGFVRLTMGPLFQVDSTNYMVKWQTPPQGVNLEGQRKGYSASNLPSFSAQRWVQDNRGVFANFAGYHVQFSSVVKGRVLWSSDLPAP